jgi:hypothetical protein
MPKPQLVATGEHHVRALEHIQRHGPPPEVVALKERLSHAMNVAEMMYRHAGEVDEALIQRIVTMRRQIDQAYIDFAAELDED